jgi:DNA polymerase-3 subunit beta
MKFIISSLELLSYLQQISKVIVSKNQLPILDNFLFELSSNQLKITGTDTENTITANIELENSEGEGRITIPSKILLDALKEFAEQPLSININLENSQIEIVSANGKFQIAGQPADEYPQTPQMLENAKKYQISEASLVKGISKTLFATSNDDLRPVFCGVQFEIFQDKLVFVASDAQKLVKYQVFEQVEGEVANVVLPKKISNVLKSTLGFNDEKINFSFDDKNIFVEVNNLKIIGQRVEGSYPNYNSVIATDNPYKLIINRNDLIKSLKRVALFANQTSLLIKLDISNNLATISAKDLDFSISGEERLPCQFDGDELEIGFQASNFIELLSNLSTPEIELQIADPTRAVNIVHHNSEDESEDILMLIVPITINL